MLQQAGRNLKMKRLEDDNLHQSITPTVTTREVRTAGDLDGLDGLVIPGGESTAIAKIASSSNFFTGLKNWMKSCERPVWGTCAGLIFMANTITDGEKKVSVVKCSCSAALFFLLGSISFFFVSNYLTLFQFSLSSFFFLSLSLSHTQSHTRVFLQGGQPLIGGLNVDVSRNYFGKQVKSFEAEIAGPPLRSKNFKKNSEQPTTYTGIFIRAPAIIRVGEGVTTLATVENDVGKEVVVAVEEGNLLATAFHPELTEDTRWHEYFVDKCVLKK